MVELTDIDVKILRFIKDHGSASLMDMECFMPEVTSLRYRVDQLSTPEYRKIHSISLPLENTSFLEKDYATVTMENGETDYRSLGIYRLTAFGDKALQDYEHKHTTHKRELWLKNAWIPILVSLVTNLLIHGIKELWPLIRELLGHIL